MKKLLLVLIVVALAAFLLVGCIPSTPAEGEGEGEGEVEICPTVSITSEVEIGGKMYIKGATQTITVTFAVPTEPVAVYVGEAIKDSLGGVPTGAKELVMYPDADKKVYTGTYRFNGTVATDCDEDYIYVATCATCAPCKYAYIVDDAAPCSRIKIYEGDVCSCGGFDIVFAGGTNPSCLTCCNDYCTALDEYTIELFKSNPFDVCCDVPCAAPIASCSGTGCDIDCSMLCVDISAYTTAETKDFYLVATLNDMVGNARRYYAKVNIDSNDIKTVTEYIGKTQGGLCTNWGLTEIGTLQPNIGDALATLYATIGGCADSDGVCSDTPDTWIHPS
jgi:predicted small secreted protein